MAVDWITFFKQDNRLPVPFITSDPLLLVALNEMLEALHFSEDSANPMERTRDTVPSDHINFTDETLPLSWTQLPLACAFTGTKYDTDFWKY